MIHTTVVIAVWDRYAGPRLSAAVASICSQDGPPLLVVVDNASTVALPELPHARVVRSPQRLTLGAARNFGLAQVRTPYVMLWDADDLMEPGTVGFLEDRLAEDPRRVAYGAAIIEEPTGQRHRWPRRWIGRLVRYPTLFAVLNCVWSLYPTTGATLMRTDAVTAAGGYADAGGGEDWCLGAALAFRGRVGWSERPGRRYLQHAGSVWDIYGSSRQQLAHAAQVRRRLAGGDAAPYWLRRLLPAVMVAQLSAVAGHEALARLRGLGRGDARDGAL